MPTAFKMNAQVVYPYIIHSTSITLFSSFSTKSPLPGMYPFSRVSMWVSYQSAVFSQAYGRIVFSVAVLKVADILSRAPPWDSHLAPRRPLSPYPVYLSLWAKLEGGEKRARLLNYELLAFQFLQSARLKGRGRARSRAQVCSRKALVGKKQIKGIALLPVLFGQPVLSAPQMRVACTGCTSVWRKVGAIEILERVST